MRSRAVVILGAVIVVALALASGAGSRVSPSDGSTYTWAGAGSIDVDVSPVGAGYVRSNPYLVDCPSACVRPVASGHTFVLTAYPTSGYTFDSWSGPCAGQGNPCTLTSTADVSATTVSFSGHYVPPVSATPLLLFTLTVNNTWINPATAPGGQTCPSFTSCQFSYTAGTTVTWTSAGAIWLGCDSSGPSTCTVTMNADRTIRAA